MRSRLPVAADHGRLPLCHIGGIAAWLLAAYSVATLVQVLLLGGPPATAAEAFALLQANRPIGLLRLDLPTFFALPLYYLIFAGLLEVLRREDATYSWLSALVGCAGVTVLLASPGPLSLAELSDRFAASASAERRTQLLAAGEAILAADVWHGTGGLVGGLLLQAGALAISIVMVRTSVFSRLLGYLGIVVHGLDLAHLIAGALLPAAGLVLMAVAGPIYLLWFPMLARAMTRLGNRADGSPQGLPQVPEPLGSRGPVDPT